MQRPAKTSAEKKVTRTMRSAGTPMWRNESPNSLASARTTSAPSQISQSTPAWPRFGGGSGAWSIGRRGRVKGTTGVIRDLKEGVPGEKQKAKSKKQKWPQHPRDRCAHFYFLLFAFCFRPLEALS